ncbi:MAG: HAD hydrolase family protein [Muribaculum sp.]|nr:HAD hydrolase family protein [Muribaculaceae bacterium]MCM1081053.1 HAD hydrolase family protein [Muribaculum sp.]
MSKIDYDLTKIKGLVFDVDGVLSPSTIPMGSDGVPSRMVNIKDGYALQLIVKLGYKVAIITGGISEAIHKRFSALGITDIYMGSSVKLDLLKSWIKQNGLTPEQVAFIGDDIPDLQAMLHVGLSVAPADAATDIKRIAKYISPVSGGYGVARDVIEELLRANGQWLDSANAFGW